VSVLDIHSHRVRRDATVAATFRNKLSSYIGGEFSQAPSTSFSIVDPATGEVFVDVDSADEELAVEAVRCAEDAGSVWRRRSPRERSDVLNRAFEIMKERRTELADLITAENGKCTAEALREVDYAGEYFRWYAEEAVRFPSSSSISPNGDAEMVVHYQPVGVSLLITPWNVPAAMVTRKLAPALAAGCTVVIKPAAQTPLTALAIAEILGEAGAPRGTVNVVVTAKSSLVVRAMMTERAVRKISFTGSTQVGRTLLSQASSRVLRSSMELGGNAPVIVLDDADLTSAIEGTLIAKMRNGGMSCVAANRIFVARKRYQEFVETFVTRISVLKQGGGFDSHSDFGPLTDGRERDRIHGEIYNWVSRGAEVQSGGYLPEGIGNFYPATTVTGLSEEDQFSDDEIFGPVAAISSFDDSHDLVERLNQSESGLAGYVFGEQDVSFVADNLQVGMLV